MYLKPDQYAIFEQLEKTIKSCIAAPTKVIFLTDTVENCLERIIRRGREFEKSITIERLEKLSGAYEELFHDWPQNRLLRIDCTNMDLRQNETVNNIVRQLLKDELTGAQGCFVT